MVERMGLGQTSPAAGTGLRMAQPTSGSITQMLVSATVLATLSAVNRLTPPKAIAAVRVRLRISLRRLVMAHSPFFSVSFRLPAFRAIQWETVLNQR